MRLTLFGEIITMAFDTVRTNKMRSALTVLGVVIGITSIVGMTAMIRGFDQSLRDMIRAVGPNTIFVQRFGVTSFASGAEFRDLLKRPNLTITDARAIEEQSETIQLVDIELGAGGPPTQRRVFYRDQKTRPIVVFGTSENFAEGTRIPLLAGRFFKGTEVPYRKKLVVSGLSLKPLLRRRIHAHIGNFDRFVGGVYQREAQTQRLARREQCSLRRDLGPQRLDPGAVRCDWQRARQHGHRRESIRSPPWTLAFHEPLILADRLRVTRMPTSNYRAKLQV